MTTPVISAADAVLALVKAALPGRTVYLGHVPSSTSTNPLPTQYAVIYPQTPTRYAEDVAHRSDMVRVEWQITSVGATAPEALWIAEHARDALVDVRPDVTGLVCGPVEHLGSQPIRWDDQVAGRVVMYSTDQYGFDATLA